MRIPLALAVLLLPTVAAAKSNIDTSLNYWGQDYPAATSAFAAEMRYVGGLGCFKSTTPGTDHTLNAEQETFLNTTGQDFIWEPCAYISNNEDNSDPDFGTLLTEHIADYHAARPNGKFIGHIEITEIADLLPDSDIIYYTATEFYRDMFVYREGCNGTGTPGYPECRFETRDVNGVLTDLGDLARNPNGSTIMDITNVNYRNFIADAIAREMAEYDVDGIVFDNFHATPNDSNTQDYTKAPLYGTKAACDFIHDTLTRNYAAGSCTYDITEIPWNATASNWDAAWLSFLTTLQTEIAGEAGHTDMLVYVSPMREEGNWSKTVIAQLDGYVQEDFAGSQSGTPLSCPADETPFTASGFYCRMRDMKELMAAADSAAKPIIVTAETKIDAGSAWCGGPGIAPWDTLGTTAATCSTDPERNPTSVSLQAKYRDFYYAAFLIANDGNIRYKHDFPSVVGDQYRAMPYYYLWRCNIGTPDNAALIMTRGVFDDGNTDYGAGTADDDSYVFRRSYSGGKVFLNTTDTAVQVGPEGVNLYNFSDTLYPGTSPITVAPHSGMILFNSLTRCP